MEKEGKDLRREKRNLIGKRGKWIELGKGNVIGKRENRRDKGIVEWSGVGG